MYLYVYCAFLCIYTCKYAYVCIYTHTLLCVCVSETCRLISKVYLFVFVLFMDKYV